MLIGIPVCTIFHTERCIVPESFDTEVTDQADATTRSKINGKAFAIINVANQSLPFGR